MNYKKDARQNMVEVHLTNSPSMSVGDRYLQENIHMKILVFSKKLCISIKIGRHVFPVLVQ